MNEKFSGTKAIEEKEILIRKVKIATTEMIEQYKRHRSRHHHHGGTSDKTKVTM